MDEGRFDDLARSLASLGTRRHLLGLLSSLPFSGALPALCSEASEAAKQRRQTLGHRGSERDQLQEQKHKRKRKKKKPSPPPPPPPLIPDCVPQSQTQTCAGKCGTAFDNCNSAVDCGSCPVCQTCVNETCVP